MTIPRLLLLVFAALLTGTLVAAGLALAQDPGGTTGPRSGAARAVAAPRAEVAAAGVLGEWDRARAAAWAAGDEAALAALYTPRSAAGRHDRAMLRSWTRRGLRVTGMRMQVLSLRVVSRSDTRLLLDVTDRLAGGEVRAVDEGGTLALPSDGATRRTVELRRYDGRWCVAAVRPAA